MLNEPPGPTFTFDLKYILFSPIQFFLLHRLFLQQALFY